LYLLLTHTLLPFLIYPSEIMKLISLGYTFDMLGLKKGVVKLAPHDPVWREDFESEKKSLLKTLGERVIDIQHIGSTAIQDVPSKPIIDIDVGVSSMEHLSNLIDVLNTLGYKQIKNYRDPDTHFIFAKGVPGKHTTHYLHLIRYDGPIWKHDLLFRDYLSNNKKRAEEYAELKEDLAKKYENDRMSYTQNKEKFIQETIELAKR
jgi:GrpB-like predicted nucleotidyltransferase (UPF0157 family)